MALSYEQVRDAVSQCRLRDWEMRVGITQLDPFYLTVCGFFTDRGSSGPIISSRQSMMSNHYFEDPNYIVSRPSNTTQVGFGVPMPLFESRQEPALFVRAALRVVMCHEMDENLLVNHERRFDPHLYRTDDRKLCMDFYEAFLAESRANARV